MTEKINLGILFGGRSCEHEVSVTSAKSILKAIDREKYQVHLIGIDKSGYWHLGDDIDSLASSGSVLYSSNHDISTDTVSLELHDSGNLKSQKELTNTESPISEPKLDIVFPVLHGTFGEDGAMQGALEMAGLPYVGCGVAASALAMDKALAKKIFESADIPQAPYIIATQHEWQQQSDNLLEVLQDGLGFPIFVKPANMGSSVGVSKANNKEESIIAINHALQFDTKIVIEQSMENCREIECAVLGNQEPEASVLGEIIPGAEFYNYETKYIDDKTKLVVPASLDPKTTEQVQALSIASFKAIDGRGLARVDFFVNKTTNAIVLNEINTLPGFTPISMYPRLWAASGLAYADLIDRLIELAMEHHRSKQSLKRAF